MMAGSKNKTFTMIKAILFDFWGTVMENGVFPSPFKQVMRSLRVQIPFGEFAQKFEESFMLTKYESLYDAFKETSKALNVNPPEFVYDNLVGLWNKNKLLAKPFPETEEALAELKKNYKLCLISNSDSFSLREVLEKYGLNQYFDIVVLSYESGLLKSDPKMFELALKKLKVKKSEAVMVGDSIESDIRGAQAAGIRAILIDRRGVREYEDKISSLKELKDVLK